MDVWLSRSEYEALPFREDIKGDYVKGAKYRSRAYKNTVFQWWGEPGSGWPIWWCFTVRGQDGEP